MEMNDVGTGCEGLNLKEKDDNPKSEIQTTKQNGSADSAQKTEHLI